MSIDNTIRGIRINVHHGLDAVLEEIRQIFPQMRIGMVMPGEILPVSELEGRKDSSHPYLMVIGSGISVKSMLADELFRTAKHRRIAIVNDGPSSPFEPASRDIKPINIILEMETVNLKIHRTMYDEMDSMLRGIREPIDDVYKSFFIEEQQRRSWLDARLGRPSKSAYLTQNKMK